MMPETLDPPRLVGVIMTLGALAFSVVMLVRIVLGWREHRREMRWYDEQLARIEEIRQKRERAPCLTCGAHPTRGEICYCQGMG